MFEKYFNLLIEKILEIVNIDSVQSAPCSASPFGEGVGKCLCALEEYCASLGFDVHNEDGYYLTASIGQGEEFGILGHVDTVPYNKNDWSANPLGEIKNDIIFGRGVLDDKGPMLCCLFAIKQLLNEGYTLKRKVKFIFGGNEESGWGCIKRYNEKDVMPKEGISPDADFPVINCEKGIVEIKIPLKKPKSLIKIKGGERSNVVLGECTAVYEGILNKPKDIQVSVEYSNDHTYIKATGKEAHGSTPEKGDNAFSHLLDYIALEDTEFASLKKAFCHIDGEGLNIKLNDSVSGNLTFNVGVVDCDKNNLYITVDIRFPISFTKEQILENINKTLNASASITHYHDPLYVDKNDPLVKALLQAYTNVTSTFVEPITIGGGTYARALPKGVAFGPIFPNRESTIHQADERVSLEDLKMAYMVYLEALKNICFIN